MKHQPRTKAFTRLREDDARKMVLLKARTCMELAAFYLLLLCYFPTFCLAQISKIDRLMAIFEAIAMKFAREVEDLYVDRCTLTDCAQANLEGCMSNLVDNPECMAGDNWLISTCGDGTTCGSLYDFSASTVSIPSDLADGMNNNPTDPQVIEAICFSRNLDSWFQNVREDNKASLNEFGIEPRSMYFGSHTGVFRIWPARQVEDCGSFDPRIRPWYVAASSGPKNVILILDTSGSMNGRRMALLKEAAERLIDTLTIGDRIAIVPFGTQAQYIADTGNTFFVATDQNKAALKDRIGALRAEGKTNFQDAFAKAFDLLDQSADLELAVNCNTAILFFTDGEMTEPEGLPESKVIEMVQNRLNISSTKTNHPIHLFTFSVSEQGENANRFPSKLACSIENGVWTYIASDDQIVDSLSSYSSLFALGLGSADNSNFAAWVEPYEFKWGNTMGTTVSVPVYDRTKNPPLFIGVVGVDTTLLALQNALDVPGDDGIRKSIDRVATQSVAVCPIINLTACAMESYRRMGSAGDAALCNNSNCTDSSFVQVAEQQCPAVSDYPQDLWQNIDSVGKSYVERVCCRIGETTVSDECPAKSHEMSKGMKAGISVAAVVFLVVVGFLARLMYQRRKRQMFKSKLSPLPPPYLSQTPNPEPELPLPIVIDTTVTVKESTRTVATAPPQPMQPGYRQE